MLRNEGLRLKKGLLCKNSAFTLIETCVVLAIVGSLSYLPMHTFAKYQAHQAEQLFLKQFESAWQASRQYVATEEDTVVILLNQNTHQIQFKGMINRQYNQVIQVPQTLKLTTADWYKLELAHAKGISPRTITIKSQLNQQIYEYKIQMMWGLLHV